MNLIQKIRNLFNPTPPPPQAPRNPVSGNILNLPQNQQYRVIKEFTDFDRTVHPIGETWVYLGTNFLPYEDGVSVFITVGGVMDSIRLQQRKEEQADLIATFSDYVEQINQPDNQRK